MLTFRCFAVDACTLLIDLFHTVHSPLRARREKTTNSPLTSNGACAFFRFVDAGDDESVAPELMAQHLAEPGMVLPVNIIFSDPTEQAARMLVETPDGTPALKVLN